MTRALTIMLFVVAVGAAPMAAPSPAQTATATPAPALWLAPNAEPNTPLEAAVELLAAGKAAVALPVFTRYSTAPVIGPFVRIYAARADLALDRLADARTAVDRVLDDGGDDVLVRAALSTSADVHLAAGEAAAAVGDLQRLIAMKPSSPASVLFRLGQAATQAGAADVARDALLTVVCDYPLAAEADDALKLLLRTAPHALDPSADTFARLRARAELLYGAGRYAEAAKAFAALGPVATGGDALMIEVRLAECDLAQNHADEARTRLLALPAHTTADTEIQYVLAGTLRVLHRDDDYAAAVQALVQAAPTSPWSDNALNDLARAYVLNDDDEHAAAVYAELYQRFPSGPHAERAAWKAGWWDYKTADYADTVRIFEDAAGRMPHANTRPAWMYWAARAHGRLGERDAAAAGYRAVIAAYRHTYYGGEALRQLDAAADPRQATGDGGDEGRDVEPVRRTVAPALDPGDPPPTAPLITALLRVGLYDEAAGEVRQAQRDFGTSPLLEATLAYATAQGGDLRSGISLMQRAYPQYLTPAGDLLPLPIQKVIYPIAYWDVIRKYAEAHHLDPYVMAALVNQESTFQADAKSAANAWGLMQVLPSTGRHYARELGIRGFRTTLLTDPVVNTRIGTAYFADLMKEFDSLPAALASYNAGESRAGRWLAERPGIDRDEFIDDIPFPETQGYVKRILALAQEYKRLYGTAR